MTNLSAFDFNGNQVRVIAINGEPWFVGADICKVLEISNTGNAYSRLKEYEKTIHTVDGLANPNAVCISESGFYRIVLTSRKPQAEQFQDWVVQVVLPSIRKTGQYQTHPTSQQQPSAPQLSQTAAIALAGLDAALSGIINPGLLAGVKLNAIAALHPETNVALDEGRKLLSHTTVIQSQLLTPTELGQRLGISARKVNQLLVEKGLQTKNPDSYKGAPAYIPTDKGLEFAEFTITTGHKGDNTSYQHLKWYPSVGNVLI